MTARTVMVYDGTKSHRPALTTETIVDGDGILLGTGAVAGSIAWTNITGKPATFPPTVPIAESDVTSLTADLAGKAASVHTHAGADITSGTVAIARIPTGSTSSTVPFGNDARFTDARTPLAHTHPESDVTGLVADLAAKAASVHTHAEADVTNLVADLATLTTAVAGKAATVHVHAAADMTSGILDPARLPIVSWTGPLNDPQAAALQFEAQRLAPSPF